MDNQRKKFAIEINALEEEENPEVVNKKIITKSSHKKEQKAPSPPEKQYYIISLEATVPATLRYRVLAEDPEQALDLIKTAPLLSTPKLHLARLKKHKADVHLSGTSIIKLTKNY